MGYKGIYTHKIAMHYITKGHFSTAIIDYDRLKLYLKMYTFPKNEIPGTPLKLFQQNSAVRF